MKQRKKRGSIKMEQVCKLKQDWSSSKRNSILMTTTITQRTSACTYIYTRGQHTTKSLVSFVITDWYGKNAIPLRFAHEPAQERACVPQMTKRRPSQWNNRAPRPTTQTGKAAITPKAGTRWSSRQKEIGLFRVMDTHQFVEYVRVCILSAKALRKFGYCCNPKKHWIDL